MIAHLTLRMTDNHWVVRVVPLLATWVASARAFGLDAGLTAGGCGLLVAAALSGTSAVARRSDVDSATQPRSMPAPPAPGCPECGALPSRVVVRETCFAGCDGTPRVLVERVCLTCGQVLARIMRQ
jgi:hypothetical protein